MKLDEKQIRLIEETSSGVIAAEAAAVKGLETGLDFVKAVELIKSRSGKIVVMGVGKSGLIGRKIAATMASTGTQSIFLHPVESLHGDLGFVAANDVVLALSYSGETEETLKLVPVFKSQGLPVVAITNRKDSRLGRLADVTLALGLESEACPFNIVPTSSTTATLALGDALAITLMKLSGFTKNSFARLHPGGNLGKLLNLKVKDLMHSGCENPVISEKAALGDALAEMTRTRLGALSVTDSEGRLTGYFTDGDLRRKLCSGELSDGLRTRISEVMTKSPTTVAPQMSAMDAAKIISVRHFDNLPVVDPDTGTAVGILDERDLLKEGLI